MGCVSSKHIKKDIKKQNLNHVVSLTSSTYGALKLDKDQELSTPVKEMTPQLEQSNSPPRKSNHGLTEIINAWELMEDLEDEVKESVLVSENKSPKLRKGFVEIDVKTPKKFLNQIGTSPKMSKRFSGKENEKRTIKASTLPPNLRISKRGGGGGRESPMELGLNSARRRNLGIMFDPDLVNPNEKKKVIEKEEIKKMVFGTPTSEKSKNPIFDICEKKSPRGGKHAVVIYTTTLRGIRKSFEDCNIVRAIIESHQVRMIERDVSMDSGFKEELRKLLGKKEVKVPVVLVKGLLYGGSEEIMKLEEEGKLGILLEGIPKMTEKGCTRCGGVRFVMCMVCNGSCKLIGSNGRSSIKCIECNENGLVQCHICC